ncbi:MAG: capsule biosynthesis protein [Pseudomonadota bacterium]
MRLGFASIYSFRPHVEHNAYLALLARQAGHEVRYLTCDAQLPHCYARALKGTSKLTECPKCIVGGTRSFAASAVSALPRGGVRLTPQRAHEFAFSSTCTVLRTEPREQWQSAEFRRLQGELAAAAARAYEGARAWIGRERLDALICFNGRFEANRAVIEAARDAGIPFLTVERTWFGDGLQFAINDNCLDLKQLDRLNARFRDVPLSERQARRVARHVAARFLRRNDKEWRAYNQQAQSKPWPAAGQGDGPRVLIVPSSRNEVDGHPHWGFGWPQLTDGLDAVLATLGADPHGAVLRCHPNWGERIGLRTGEPSERYYGEWARRRGVHLIDSRDRASTFDLIAQADVVVVTGGSAAFEAAALGKPVISLTPSAYQTAGICVPVRSADDLAAVTTAFDLAPRERMRRVLRYGYTHIYRFSQFVDHVRAVTTTRYRYYEGADPARIERMLASGEVEPDDPATASDAAGEDAVVAAVQAQEWEQLLTAEEPPTAHEIAVRRRPALRWIDALRERLPRGDR